MRRFSGSADRMNECAGVNMCGRLETLSKPKTDNKSLQNTQADILATAVAAVGSRIDEMSRPPASTLPRAVFSGRKLLATQRCGAGLLP